MGLSNGRQSETRHRLTQTSLVPIPFFNLQSSSTSLSGRLLPILPPPSGEALARPPTVIVSGQCRPRVVAPALPGPTTISHRPGRPAATGHILLPPASTLHHHHHAHNPKTLTPNPNLASGSSDFSPKLKK